MKLTKVDSYRDGGTLEAVFADGTALYVDRRIDTPTRDALYASYPDQAAAPIEGSDSATVALIVALHEQKEAIRRTIRALYGWDLSDDPHGYAGDIDRVLLKSAKELGIRLPPSPNI